MKVLLGKFITSLLRFIPFVALISLLALLTDITEKLPLFMLALLCVFLGVFLFDLGTNESAKIATDIAKALVKKKSLVLFVLMAFLLGLILAVSEPNTWIMANFIKGFLQEKIFVLAVGIGIGVTLTIALLRIVFKLSIKSLFIVLYLATLMIALIASIRNPMMVLLAFDSGGVIPGIMLIPFLIGLSVGIGQLRSDKVAGRDAFGMVGIVTLGPILSLLILGLYYPTENIMSEPLSMVEYLIRYVTLMAFVFVPLLIIYWFFNYKRLLKDKTQLFKKLIAFIYTYVGIVLVLTGINGGLLNFARLLGENLPMIWAPLFMIGLGLSIVIIEPSIKVLVTYVLDVTAGAIPKRFITWSLVIAMLMSIIVISLRLIFSISLWWIIIPGYVIAIVLSLFSKDVFLSIAFDAGGATNGLLTVGFLLPFLLGLTKAEDALGNILIIQLMPLIVIQTLALIMKKERYLTSTTDVDDIIDI